MKLEEMGKKARQASHALARTGSAQKNDVLFEIGRQVWADRNVILSANQQDIRASSESGLSPALLDRLTLNEERLLGMVSDLKDVARLSDPVGEIFDEEVLENGLQVHKQRVPLGVLGVIYESRPNVTLDVASLALKSGNTAILRGGSETLSTNRALVDVICSSLAKIGLSRDVVQFVDDPDRSLVMELLKLYEYIDMIIPRGGAVLHKFCRENSLIPVITGGIGICHLFVDDSANLDAALQVIRNAKIQRPTVCNALDTVLVHEKVANNFIPRLVKLLAADGVSFRADPSSYAILSDMSHETVRSAGPDDFDTEWLSLVLGIKVVSNLEEAVEHIATHSTSHSDGILTGSEKQSARFVSEVNSAVVYVNASTRFTDGGQLGLGAEVAVSTQRLHARGPMGLRALTTYKWVVTGNYHTRP